VSDAIEALRRLVEDDPGHPSFPVWVEWLRRQGRLDEARGAAESGLDDAPGRAEGRAALALVHLDRDDASAAREALVRAITALPGAEVLSPPPADEPAPVELDDALEAEEIDEAFLQAEARPEEMMSANDIAERAMAEAMATPEVDAAEALDAAPASIELEPQSAPAPDAADRARVIATLELWLQNLRRTVQ
jgi:hypothetical protein